MSAKPDLRIVSSELAKPQPATGEQFAFVRVEGRLVAIHNGTECSIAEAVHAVTQIAVAFYGDEFGGAMRLVKGDGGDPPGAA